MQEIPTDDVVRVLLTRHTSSDDPMRLACQIALGVTKPIGEGSRLDAQQSCADEIDKITRDVLESPQFHEAKKADRPPWRTLLHDCRMAYVSPAGLQRVIEVWNIFVRLRFAARLPLVTAPDDRGAHG